MNVVVVVVVSEKPSSARSSARAHARARARPSRPQANCGGIGGSSSGCGGSGGRTRPPVATVAVSSPGSPPTSHVGLGRGSHRDRSRSRSRTCTRTSSSSSGAIMGGCCSGRDAFAHRDCRHGRTAHTSPCNRRCARRCARPGASSSSPCPHTTYCYCCCSSSSASSASSSTTGRRNGGRRLVLFVFRLESFLLLPRVPQQHLPQEVHPQANVP